MSLCIDMVEGNIQLFFLFSRQAEKNERKVYPIPLKLKTVCLLFVSVESSV
jgi:hypothetical protein